MSRGKSTCKVLKEVRREIARTNGIPLEERECTHKGDCAGTCPYCEAEVRYLERELSKRKSLGKAVAVAGIALSAVTMAGCATSELVSKESGNTKKTPGSEVVKVCSQAGAVVVSDEQILANERWGDGKEVVVGRIEGEPFFNESPSKEEFVPKSIEGYEDATFPEEYGTPASWLRSKLTEFNTYIQQPRMDEVEIRFFVEVNGGVSSVVILNMPETSTEKDNAFQDAVREALLSMPRWHCASVRGKPVSALITIRVKDLR